MALIASERPSASCSMTRNFALASASSATSWSKTSPATDDLLRQDLECLVKTRHLAVGRRDACADRPAVAALDHLGHQRLDAGLAQGPGHKAHLLPAPMGMHDVGLHQHGDEVGEADLIDVAHAAHDFLEDALALGGDIGLDAQRLDTLDEHTANHLPQRGAARPVTQPPG